LIRRIGCRYTILGGLIFFALIIAALATINEASSIILVGVVYYYFAGIRIVITIVSLNIAGTTGVASERQGLAAGLLGTAQQIGAAIGVSGASLVITTAAVHNTISGSINTPGTVHPF